MDGVSASERRRSRERMEGFSSVRAVLIGRNRRGHPVYVRFFAGAVAPDPPS
jgi:hypothetical protein